MFLREKELKIYNVPCVDPIKLTLHFVFTVEQLRQGWVVLHVFAAVYFFILLAIICNDYFLPTVECICEDLHLSKDVAAATFMATATSMPEFFTNTISTLILESDMGLGTIIGSLMFNTLGVAGLAALCIDKVDPKEI